MMSKSRRATGWCFACAATPDACAPQATWQRGLIRTHIAMCPSGKTALAVPPEYIDALIYSLAVRLCMNYGRDPKPSLVMAMKVAMNTVRMANVQIPQLLIPGELLGPGQATSDYSSMVGLGLGSAFVLGQGAVL